MEITVPWLVTLWLLSLIVSFWIGSFVRPYLGERAKNLATHDDLKKLTEQVVATTEAAKRIEARISDEVWNRQRQWELKREVLLDAVRRLAEADDALRCLKAIMLFPEANNERGQLIVEEEKGRALTRWKMAGQSLDETRLTVSIVCDRRTQAAFEAFGSTCHAIAARLSDDPHCYEESHRDLYLKLLNAQNRIREELGVSVVAADDLALADAIARAAEAQ